MSASLLPSPLERGRGGEDENEKHHAKTIRRPSRYLSVRYPAGASPSEQHLLRKADGQQRHAVG